MAKIIREHPHDVLFSFAEPYRTLANAIVGQQISVKAAESIWQRLLAHMPGKKISAKNILAAEDGSLRQLGLSRQKILYLKNIAEHFIKNKITPKYFEIKSSREIAEELISIKGIGKWTLEMFQIFYLHETDIFPIGDIGLIKAISNHYPRVKTDKEKLLKFSLRWAPYRTVATWYLWRTFDDDLVQY